MPKALSQIGQALRAKHVDGVRSGKTRALGKSTINRYRWERAQEFCGVALEVSKQFLLRHTLQPEIKLASIVAATFVVVCVCLGVGVTLRIRLILWEATVVPILAAPTTC